MSILNVPPKYRRSATEAVVEAEAVETESADAQKSTPLIEWNQPGEDLWVGKIGLDHAGMIELVDSRFIVTDWKNERVDVCATLDEAKWSLEPAARISAKAEADRVTERQQWIASSTFALTIVVAATIGGWVITAI